jgi:hypothetical protein
MAGRGPAPKDPAARRRRNATGEQTKVAADGETRGPALPETHDWPPATLAWWETWRSSAQAKTFTDTDWSFLLDTAVLHAEFWLGDRSVAAELRLRAAKFGATPEDRARLKLEVGEPTPAPAAARKGLQPKKAADRKQRLLQAVEGGASEAS